MTIEEAVAKRVAKAANWTKDTVRQSMEAAAEQGICADEYLRFSCWELSENELTELAALLERVHVRQKQDEEWFLQIAHRRTLRSVASLRKEMDRFKALGISPLYYTKKGFYFPKRAKKAEQEAVKHKNRSEKKSVYFKKICERTGWSASRAEIEVTKAWLNCGANYEDFYRFKLHARSEQEQKTYLTHGHYDKMTIYFNHYLTKKYLNTKSSFNRIYASHIKRRWFVNQKLSYSRFLKKIDGLEDILVKPVSATHGKGIQKFHCNVEDKRALYDAVMAFPKSVVEEYIVQHQDIAAFCSASVNTLRIVTLNAQGKCNFLFAVIRMGRGDIVDNVHSGGIAAAVDPKTGVVTSDALDADGNLHVVHPCSKLPIKGFQIPNWDAVLDLCQTCCRRIPGVNLIGWDIAITADGVELIEGNSAPSFVTIQATALQDGKGLRADIFDPYLSEI